MVDIIFAGVLFMSFIGIFFKDRITNHIRSRSSRVQPDINIVIPDDNTCSMVSQDDNSIVD
jgi:hypothetical protein